VSALRRTKLVLQF